MELDEFSMLPQIRNVHQLHNIAIVTELMQLLVDVVLSYAFDAVAVVLLMQNHCPVYPIVSSRSKCKTFMKIYFNSRHINILKLFKTLILFIVTAIVVSYLMNKCYPVQSSIILVFSLYHKFPQNSFKLIVFLLFINNNGYPTGCGYV